MILVLGATDDPMVAGVAETLGERGADFAFVSVHEIPGTVRLQLGTEGRDALIFNEGVLDLQQVKGVYHRAGFAHWEVYEDFSEPEVRFINDECTATFTPWLNTAPGLVVNRPRASVSNGSKPYQLGIVARHGFGVPDTLVTNHPGLVSEFYDKHNEQVIYKSISYIRSIVQKMTEDDLNRLDTLNHGPIQLQERIEGFDVRVHVVGDRVFPCRIDSESSDYRYDKQSNLIPWEISDEVAERCVAVTKELGLVISGVDLRITPEGRDYCFEVNPTPAFRWYEDRAGLPITDALCDLLCSQ